LTKKDSYPIPRPPSWDDRNCSYGHQLYPSDDIAEINAQLAISNTHTLPLSILT